MDASQPSIPTQEVSNDSETNQNQSQPMDAQELPPTADGPIDPDPKAKKPPRAPPNVDRPPGKSLLPMARIQKIMRADKELPMCNKEATFLISVSTEEFIKRLGKASHQQAVREKRTTVQRKDVVTAVRKVDEFVFLEELMTLNVPTPAPASAPAKRKPKPGPAPDAPNIKDAFGKGKGKPSADLDADINESMDVS